jgi:hypothetical protein
MSIIFLLPMVFQTIKKYLDSGSGSRGGGKTWRVAQEDT